MIERISIIGNGQLKLTIIFDAKINISFHLYRIFEKPTVILSCYGWFFISEYKRNS